MSLAVENLQVCYRTLHGDVNAVDGVTFGIRDGEIAGLAGESGCGKTTLAKSLIRLDGRMRHIAGRVVLDGTELPIANDAAMNRFRFGEVSLIPQYALSALNPTRKIGRLTSELLRSRGVAYDEKLPELKRRLALVGLSADVLDRFPIELSGGMKQRVVMVLSTLLDPSLLIADELTSALDVSTQKAVAELLVEFRDRGFVKSTIVITHALNKVKSTDTAKAQKIHTQLQKIILDDLPAIALWYNGMWAQYNTSVWTNFPKSSGSGLQHTPTTWNGYLNMTGIDGLAALKLRK